MLPAAYSDSSCVYTDAQWDFVIIRRALLVQSSLVEPLCFIRERAEITMASSSPRRLVTSFYEHLLNCHSKGPATRRSSANTFTANLTAAGHSETGRRVGRWQCIILQEILGMCPVIESYPPLFPWVVGLDSETRGFMSRSCFLLHFSMESFQM